MGERHHRGRGRPAAGAAMPKVPGTRNLLQEFSGNLQLTLLRLHLAREPAPGSGAEPQHGPAAVVGVTHEHVISVRGRADFDAIGAAVVAIARLAPAVAVYAFHRSSATFKIRSREAMRVSASLLTRSNIIAARRTKALRSVVRSSTASMYRTSGLASRLAIINVPDRPGCAPVLAGTTWTQT